MNGASRRRPNLETYFHHDCRDFYIVFVNGGMKSKLILWLLRPCVLNFDYHFLKESFHKKTNGLTVQSQLAAFIQHTVLCAAWEALTPAPGTAGVRRLRRRCSSLLELRWSVCEFSWARVEEIWHFEIVICWFASLLSRFQYSFVNRFTKPELRISKSITIMSTFLNDCLIFSYENFTLKNDYRNSWSEIITI